MACRVIYKIINYSYHMQPVDAIYIVAQKKVVLYIILYYINKRSFKIITLSYTSGFCFILALLGLIYVVFCFIVNIPFCLVLLE